MQIKPGLNQKGRPENYQQSFSFVQDQALQVERHVCSLSCLFPPYQSHPVKLQGSKSVKLLRLVKSFQGMLPYRSFLKLK